MERFVAILAGHLAKFCLQVSARSALSKFSIASLTQRLTDGMEVPPRSAPPCGATRCGARLSGLEGGGPHRKAGSHALLVAAHDLAVDQAGPQFTASTTSG